MSLPKTLLICNIVVSDLERGLLALPVRMGGLGLCDPSAVADFEFNSSLKVTSSLMLRMTTVST